MRNIILVLVLFLVKTASCSAQILHPVKWSYGAKKTGDKRATIFIKAIIEKGWHIYSVHQPRGGPQKTSFNFVQSDRYKMVGDVIEPTPIVRFEKVFGIKVKYFEKSVIFQQKLLMNSPVTVVKGHVNFMVCNDHQCLPPEDVDFSIPVK
ncbi:MAG TPA: protein-disulfide reductase DsbD domain-containing protein [Mucilaginibacter sp.]